MYRQTANAEVALPTENAPYTTPTIDTVAIAALMVMIDVTTAPDRPVAKRATDTSQGVGVHRFQQAELAESQPLDSGAHVAPHAALTTDLGLDRSAAAGHTQALKLAHVIEYELAAHCRIFHSSSSIDTPTVIHPAAAPKVNAPKQNATSAATVNSCGTTILTRPTTTAARKTASRRPVTETDSSVEARCPGRKTSTDVTAEG